jgi:hypothetical protein|tara:strand:- start:92 stop:526 length:435 start_codon:yes stop_codon:yes gene_type:complete
MTEGIKKSEVSLRELLTPSKTVSIDYPEFLGFSVDLCYLAREELIKLRARCLSQKLNRKTRGFEEVLDDEKFLTEYTKAVIKGWKGLKIKYLQKMVLIDASSMDEESELPYTQENAELLMQNSNGFDQWVTEVTQDLENFTMLK